MPYWTSKGGEVLVPDSIGECQNKEKGVSVLVSRVKGDEIVSFQRGNQERE